MLNATRRRIRPRLFWSSAPIQRVVPATAVGGVHARGIVVDAPIPKKSKVWDSVDEAVADIKDGSVILSGGAFIIPDSCLVMGDCRLTE